MKAAAALGAVVAGILVGERLPPGPAVPVLAAAGSAAATAALARGRLRAVTALAGLAALLLLAAASDARARHGLIDTPLVAQAEVGMPVTAWVTLVTDPEAREFSGRAVARLEGRRVLLDAGRDVRSPLLVLGAGDAVLVDGRLTPLPEREGRWRRRHVVAVLRVAEVVDARPPAATFTRAVEAFRGTVLRGGASLPPDLRALSEGFLVGETRDMPDHLVSDFRRSGLSHLLAVSGANVAVVLACLSPLLSTLSLRGRLVAGGIALLVFGAVTRWEPSVLRAVAMAGIGLAAAATGRPLPGLRTLCLAATALLLADPFLLWSVGFRLSCAASAGILVLAGPIAAHLPGPPAFRTAAATTLGAQLAVAPVLLPTFGSMPLVAVPANLVVAPLAGPVTIWGLAAGVVGGVLAGPLPELGWLLQRPSAALLAAIAAVARTAATVPVEVGGGGALALAATATPVAFLVAARRQASRRLAGDGAPDAPTRHPDL